MTDEKTYQCPECGLHYADEALAKACEEYCRTHQACNLEIAQRSIEAQQKAQ